MGYGGRGSKPNEFDNNMRGALFDKDPKSDTDPDFGGQCEIDGVEYWVAAWWKKSKKVGDYISLSFTIKDERSSQRNDTRRGSSRGPSSDDRGRGGPPARSNPGRRGPNSDQRDDNGFEDDDIPF